MSTFNLDDKLIARLQAAADDANLTIEQLIEQMLAERNLLRATLEAVPASITIADATQPNTPVTHANSKFEQLTGYPTDKTIGTSLTSFTGDSTPSFDQALPVSLTEPADRIFVSYRQDGSQFQNRLRLFPVRDRSGFITHVIAIHEDVSRQVALTKQVTSALAPSPTPLTTHLDQLADRILDNELLFSSVIATAPDACIIIDEAERVRSFNRGASQIFGYAHEEIVGQSFRVLIPEDVRAAHDEHVRGFTHNQDQQLSMNGRNFIRGCRKDGTEFPARASVTKYHTDGQTLFVTILQDMSWESVTRQRLQESETRYRMISELSSDYAYAYHRQPNGRFRLAWITDAVEAITGYSGDELIHDMGRFREVLRPEDKPTADAIWQRLVTTPTTQTLEHRLIRKDGTEIIVQSRYRSVATYDADQVSHIYGVSQDITAQRNAEQQLIDERNLLSDIMETSPAGITVVDTEGNIIYANQRGNEIMRTTEDDVTQLDYDSPEWRHTDFDGNPWPDEKQPFVRIMRTKESVWNVRHAIESTTGERVYLSINGMPQLDADGKVKRIVFTIEDVSVQKTWEDNLRALLEREAELSNVKSRFLSFVSHEFRTPLSVILTSTGILRKYYDRISKENRLRRIQIIENQVNRLDRMLDDVSNLNKLQVTERPLEYVTIQVDTYFHNIIEEVELAYPNAAQILYQSDDICAEFTTDEMHFYQILTNLLTNAAKYTPSDKSIWLVVRCQPDALLITVRDAGIGIPADEQKSLFNAFRRASNVGDIPGTGMGLVILKNSVDALGGKVDFDSVENEGTTFRVQLPTLNSDNTAT